MLTVNVKVVEDVIEKKRKAQLREAPVRKLRMVELCAGSCRITKQVSVRVRARAGVRVGVLGPIPNPNQARRLRWDGHAYERDETRPEWDEAEDEAAKQAPLPRSAMTVTDIMTLDPNQIPAVDFAWLSPPCTSTSNIAQSTHRRTEENDYEGETVEAEKFNEMVQHQADICTIMKAKSPAFAFILEQPQGQARKVPGLVQRFERSRLGGVRCTVHM